MSDIFELEHENTFDGDVVIPLPGNNKSKTLSLTFKWLGKTDRMTYLKSVQGKEDVEALSEIVLDWKNVDLEFNNDNFAKLLDNYSNSGLAIINYWIDETGRAKEKN